MAQVKFVFTGGSELVVRAATDRSAKLIATGLRRKMEADEVLAEVKSESGSVFINPMNLSYVQPMTSGTGGTKRKSSGKKSAPRKASGKKRKR
jgi:hypothetical protein